MNNAVIYARYSSERQTEQSIEGQLRVCHDYAKRCGYRVIGEYIDRALSGRYDDRPSFQQMVTDAAQYQFQFIIVYKLDRFARNRYDSATYKHKLKKCGVRVVSAMESLSDNPESIMLEAVLEANAEYFSANLSQNVKRGMLESAKKGQTIGAVPLGYKSVDKKIIIDDAKAHIVQFIFEQYANGASKQYIANQLNEKGYRTKYGNVYNINSLTHILRNHMYKGEYMYKGDVVSSCPAIIDPVIFDKVQERLNENKSLYRKNPKSHVAFGLVGKIFCGVCGSPMCGDSGTSRSKEKYYYYTCIKRKQHIRSGKEKCMKKSEQKDFLEWYVAEQTQEYVLNPKNLEYIAEQIVACYADNYNINRIASYNKQIKIINRELDKYTEKLLNTSSESIISRINEKAAQLEQQLESLEAELSVLKIAVKNAITKDEVTSFIQKYCKGDICDQDFRRNLFDTFVNAVYLYDDKVVIYYNLKDSKQVSYIEMIDHLKELDESQTVRPSHDMAYLIGGWSNRIWVLSTIIFCVIIIREEERK